MVRRGFNPRPRTGGARGRYESVHLSEVSIHAPAKGATWDRKDYHSRSSFNPRPREGGDFPITLRPLILRVSIHAPAKGATKM